MNTIRHTLTSAMTTASRTVPRRGGIPSLLVDVLKGGAQPRRHTSGVDVVPLAAFWSAARGGKRKPGSFKRHAG